MNAVFNMAGRNLAQAIYELSENKKFAPMIAFINHSGTEAVIRCALKNEHGRYEAERKMNALERSQRGAVFIRKTIVAFEAGDVDCLLIDIRLSGSRSRRLQYCLPFQQHEELERFELSRLMLNFSVGFSHRKPETIDDSIWQGIQQHALGWKAVLDCYNDTEHPKILKRHQGTGLTEEEFQRVKFAPLIVLHQIAQADREANAKEIEVISAIINSSHLENGLLLARFFEESLAPLWQQLEASNPDYPFELTELIAIVDNRLSQIEAHLFKTALMEFGYKVANASGGFLGFGNKVSEKEKTALARVRMSLGLI